MVEYEAFPVDLEQTDTILHLQLPTPRILTTEEMTVQGVDPVYGTIPCEAAELDLLDGSITRLVFICLYRTHIGAELDVEGSPSQHISPPDYYRSREAQSLLVLSALPASEWGYLRIVTMSRHGKNIPFLTTVLDGDIPTGLITTAEGKSTTILQNLRYIAHARRTDQEYESEEIDLTGEVPTSIEITVRRKTSSKLNKKKIR